jgi:hypothetical protein
MSEALNVNFSAKLDLVHLRRCVTTVRSLLFGSIILDMHRVMNFFAVSVQIWDTQPPDNRVPLYLHVQPLQVRCLEAH